jgi:hypothetical protein
VSRPTHIVLPSEHVIMSSSPTLSKGRPSMSRFRTQVREVINRNTVVSLALEQGFNVFLPVYDGGVDFILYREKDRKLRKVQLKSRWTIDRRYKGRDIWIAFPIDDHWYLMPHDEMLKSANASVTKSTSWTDKGSYHQGRPSAAMKVKCAQYRFAPISKVASKAAAEAEQSE